MNAVALYAVLPALAVAARPSMDVAVVTGAPASTVAKLRASGALLGFYREFALVAVAPGADPPVLAAGYVNWTMPANASTGGDLW
eukprot:gene7084-6710_t